MLKAEYGVIGVANLEDLAHQARLHLVLQPLIENMVKVDVGEQWADDLPLPRPRLTYEQFPLVDYANVYPLSNQPENACITYPALDHLHELFSHDRVKVGADVHFHHTLHRPPAYHSVDFMQRVVCTSSRAKSVGTVEKVLLEDRVEQRYRGLLHDLVFKGRDRDWSLAPIFLVDIDPAQRLRTIRPALQHLMQLAQIPNQMLLVFRIRDSVH